MPPKAAASRKGPAFKPPRPVKSAAQSSSTKPAATTKKAAPAKSKSSFQIPTLISSSDEEADLDAVSNSEEDRGEPMDDASEPEIEASTGPPPASLGIALDPIPKGLLARLLHEGFEDKGTQIQRGALDLTGKYMEIFVREAIARARFERPEDQRGRDDGFLQVEDLEKLAPQLLLDF